MREVVLFLILSLFLFSCQNKQKTLPKKELQADEIMEEEIPIPTSNFHSFRFHCIDNCGKKEASMENMNTYGKKNPYDIQKEENDSIITINFRFVDDCCLKHKGIANMHKQTLELSYINISKEVCECWCEYTYHFNIRKAQEIDSIILNGKAVE